MHTACVFFYDVCVCVCMQMEDCMCVPFLRLCVLISEAVTINLKLFLVLSMFDVVGVQNHSQTIQWQAGPTD